MRTHINPIICFVALCCMVYAGPVRAADIYVDSDAPGTQSGTSWVNAYHYLQDALSAAQFGDIIKVGQGTYRPDQATAPTNQGRLSTFQLKFGVAVMGGYAGYSTFPTWQWDNRDPLLYPTILSGDLNGNDTTLDPNNVDALLQLNSMSVRQDNCYNIVTANYVDRSAVLDGFTIQGGMANGTPNAALLVSTGGGIVINAASPTIRNCIIVNCSAVDNGGGMYVQAGGEPNLVDCTFRANYSAYNGGGASSSQADPNFHGTLFDRNVVSNSNNRWGGGLYCADSNLVMEGCQFYANNDAFYGGALSAERSNLSVANTTFTNNYSRYQGGAVYTSMDSYGKLVNCHFVKNISRYDGGALYCKNSSVEAIQCGFIANTAQNRNGGAVYCEVSDPNMADCVFNGNIADERGGGLCYNNSTGALIANCTFSANQATSGEAFACFSRNTRPAPSDVTVTNSILWDAGNEIYNGDTSSISVSYSAIWGGYPGQGNKQYNPSFSDYRGKDHIAGNEDDDLRLSSTSGYIDSGNNNLVPSYLTEDLIHMPRFIDDFDRTDSGVGTAPIVDRGAYEYGDPNSLAPPIANAGADIVVSANAQGQATVILDGSGSYDPNGDPLHYQWTWTLNQQTHTSNLVRPSVTLPVGQYVFQLVVFDGITYSDPNSVMVTVVSTGRPPTANAGPDQTVILTSGSTVNVQLDGSSSHDPDGDPLQYQWTWMIGSTPYQSVGVSPVVQLPLGVHVISLVVYDGTYYSSEDKVTIRVTGQNRAPVANAGPDQTLTASSSSGTAAVTLDGSASYDPDGDSLTYAWQWTVNSTLQQRSGVSPNISLPVGQYTLSLVVSDGSLSSTADTVIITVNAPSNHAPVANAGPDQTVTITSGSTASVTLNGSGSTDPDGDPLQYVWNYTINSQSYQANGISPTIQLPAGQYTIQLVVFDGTAVSNPDTVVITVNQQQTNHAPVANAGPDQTVTITSGSTANVILDGSGSTDLDGNSLQYFWSYSYSGQSYQVSGVHPIIQLPVGQYTVQLVVSDGSLYSSPDTVIITVTQTNHAPVANAGPDQSVTITSGSTANVTLNGTGSYDPDGSSLSYIWTYTIGSVTYTRSGVTPTIQLPTGTYNIKLVVSDGALYSNADYVVITVTQGNQKPVANAGPDQTVTTTGSSANVTLDGSGSYDPDGSITQYIWTWTQNSTAHQATGVHPTVSLPVGQTDITLIVYDGAAYSNPDHVIVTVTQGNQAPVANAGPDQTLTVSPGQQASVTLDGSGSYDPDGSISLYYWTWTIDSVNYQAYGVSPTITLPAGTHVIQLVVFDGTNTSAPDTVTITVNEESGGQISVLGWPSTVTPADTSNYVLMFVTLPNTDASTVNANIPLVLYPGGAQSAQLHVTQQSDGSTMVFAMFNEQDVLNSVSQNGSVNFTVFGQYNDGSLFVGNTTLTLSH